MSTLTDILRDGLGCTPGARGCLVHGNGWPCDVLVDLEARVEEWHEERVADRIQAIVTARRVTA